MGYIKHHAIVVTGWDDKAVHAAKLKAKAIFEHYFKDDPFFEACKYPISEIVRGLANGQWSFFVAPDGSNEGRATSNTVDSFRKEFLDYLKSNPAGIDYIEVLFGGDDESEMITRSKDMDRY